MNYRKNCRVVLLIIFCIMLFINPVKANAADNEVNVEVLKGCNENYHYRVMDIDVEANLIELQLYYKVQTGSDIPQYALNALEGIVKDIYHKNMKLSDFGAGVSVGDIYHNDFRTKCTQAHIDTVVHKCKEDGKLYKLNEKAATCEEIGYIDGYYCMVVGCERIWEDEDAKTEIKEQSSAIFPALGHNFVKTLKGDTLTYSHCQNEGCDMPGGQISLYVDSEDMLMYQVNGVDNFENGTGIDVSKEEIYLFKSTDEQVSNPTEAGDYYALLTVDGLTLRKDFVIGDKCKYYKSEIFTYADIKNEIGTFETDNFRLIVPAKFPGVSRGGWYSGPRIYDDDSLELFVIESKGSAKIRQINFYTKSLNGGALPNHNLIFDGEKTESTTYQLGDYLMTTGKMNNSRLGLEPSSDPRYDYVNPCGEIITKIVIYYYDEENHTHVFDRKYKQNNTLKEDMSCIGKKIYYYSCICGEVSKTDSFEVEVPLCAHDVDADKSLVPRTEEYLKSEATCSSKALYYYKCKKCQGPCKSEEESYNKFFPDGEYGSHKKADIENSIRDYRYVASYATCTNPAVYYYSCIFCNRKMDETYEYGVASHIKTGYASSSKDEKFLKSASNCQNNAVYYYECYRCHAVMDETYEYTEGGLGDHIASSKENAIKTADYLKVAATCSNPAVYYYDCSVCHSKLSDTYEYGDTLSHVFDKEVVDEKYLKSQATCQSPAIYSKSCECGEKGKETFTYGKKLNHTFDQKVANNKYLKSRATCIKLAEYYMSCTCGEKGTKTFTYGKYTDHSWDEGTITKKPTTSDEGVKTYKCKTSGCKEIKTESIDRLVETDTDKVIAFVRRIYSDCLGRTPEEDGVQYWSNELTSGNRDGASVGAGFVFSEEYISKGVSKKEYVKMLYIVFMGREADEGGMNYWLDNMKNGMTREEVFKGFVDSPEYTQICADYGINRGNYTIQGIPDPVITNGVVTPEITSFVERIYEKALNRESDSNGIAYWSQEIANETKSPVEVAELFIFSEEFESKHLDNTEYVKVLYRTFMGREYDDAGLNYWLGNLASGTSRKDVLESFAGCPEFQDILKSFGL